MRNHMVSICRKRCSLVKSASILLTTKDILQITKEGYTNPVRGCGCAWRAPAKTNQNHFSTIVCLWNIVKTMKMSLALSVKRLLGQRICYATSRMYTKKDHDKTGNSNSSQIDMNLNFEQVDQLASVDLDQAIVLPFDM